MKEEPKTGVEASKPANDPKQPPTPQQQQKSQGSQVKSGSNQQQPQAPTYGGDEISAIVLDCGSMWLRAGFSGEDTPKCYVPSHLGVVTNEKKKIYIGDSKLSEPVSDMEIVPTVSEGIVTNFDAACDLWSWCFNQHLRVDTQEHPLMITEPSNNPSNNRVKTMETAFEGLNVPAFYLVQQAVASSFAQGKPSALIVDVGAEMTSVVPVFEGLTLNRGIVKQKLAGSYINQAIHKYITNSIPADSIKLRYEIERKSSSPTSDDFVERTGIASATSSFHKYHHQRLLHEIKETVCQIYHEPLTDKIQPKVQSALYEFPRGNQMVFENARVTFAEPIFNPSFGSKIGVPVSDSMEGLAQLIARSIWACDPDLLSVLLNNVIVVGGTTQIPGFCDRLHNDLASIIPGSKIKLTASTNMIERTCSSWLGGSILSSLGTFHQLWISKAEYQEQGADRAAFLEKRCK